MSSLLIRNILTLDPLKPGPAREMDLLVRDGVIAEAGTVEAAKVPPGTVVIEGRNKLLLPGLVNAHTHSPLNVLKGTGDVLSHPAFMWQNQADTAGRTPDEVRLSALLGCIENLLNGTTGLIDHFPEQGFTEAHVDAVVEAYEMSGMRALVALRIFDESYDDILPPRGLPDELARINPLAPLSVEENMSLVEQAISRHHGRAGRIHLCPAPSNPSRCSDALLEATKEVSERHDTAVHMHLLETRIQAEIAQERYGTTMVGHLDQIGLLSSRLSCAHTVWIGDDDIALMAERGAIVVHNPESNLKLGVGIAPIARMLKAGVTVALGTDGASTNDNLDLHEVIRLAIMLQRPGEPDRGLWPTAHDGLVMATVAGGRAMQLSGSGTLAIGAPADFTIHDLTKPFWTPLNDAACQLVFGGSGTTVDTVIVGWPRAGGGWHHHRLRSGACRQGGEGSRPPPAPSQCRSQPDDRARS